MKNILVVLGHPRNASFCGALADAYVQAARAAGAEVRVLKLADLRFDPVLHDGYAQIQPQSDITWAQHLVFVYPNWWGTLPSILKGFFDRTLLPGYAFQYGKDSPLWEKLLKGRSARVLVTMDSPSWYYRFIVGAPGDKQIRNSVLEFCGVKPVRIRHFGPIRTATDTQRARWLDDAKSLAAQDV
jgi:putative NADPH-quinone reductase